MAYGAAFGAIQQMPQIVPGLPEVRAMAQGSRRRRRADRAARCRDVTKVQEIGGLVGRILLAFLAVCIVSRRKLIRMFQMPGLIVMPSCSACAARTDLHMAVRGACSSPVCHRVAIQFLGQLPAAGVSRLSARHR